MAPPGCRGSSDSRSAVIAVKEARRVGEGEGWVQHTE